MENINKLNKEYKVHPDDIDVRNWDVSANGFKLGVVNDLVFDRDTMRVKYLDLTRSDSTDNKNYHYLIPMDQVNFDRHNKSVNFHADSHHFLNTYPRFSNEMPFDYEEKVRKYYSDTYTREYPDQNSESYERKVYANEFYDNKTNTGIVEEQKESPFGNEYEKIKGYPGNLNEKIDVLERQKQIKMLEKERDIALINKEILLLKERLR